MYQFTIATGSPEESTVTFQQSIDITYDILDRLNRGENRRDTADPRSHVPRGRG